MVPEQALVQALRERANFMREFSYAAGASRCTFVSSHQSRWRTTVFAANPQAAEAVMAQVLTVLGEESDDSCFSHTTPRPRQLNPLRGRDEMGQRQNNQDLFQVTNMHLKKVVLFCNGHSPISLFQR